MALQSLRIPYEHCFSCDTNEDVRKTLQHNFGDKFLLFEDITTRNTDDLPLVDLYHAGFPCQPFSMAGKGEGTSDPRGQLIFKIMETIVAVMPVVVILENVRGLVLRHREVLDWVLTELTALNYHTSWKVLNAKHHGVPQNRERLFIVGIKKQFLRHKMDWPDSLPPVSVMKILDRPRPSDNPFNLPPESQATARAHVQSVLRDLKTQGLRDATSLASVPIIIDVDSSKLHAMHDTSPCLTRSRGMGGGHWVLARGRRFTAAEQERLFGLHLQPPSGRGQSVAVSKPPDVSARAWGGIIGNSIPVPMLARVVCMALAAAGRPVPDVWQAR